jgi:hypothetical protein
MCNHFDLQEELKQVHCTEDGKFIELADVVSKLTGGRLEMDLSLEYSRWD